MTWRTDEPPKDGTIIYRRVWSVFRYQPYKPNTYQHKRGDKGRWQEMNEYGGWDNCNHPMGNEWRYDSPNIEGKIMTDKKENIEMKYKHYTMQFFQYEHLPPHLQEVSKPFGELAKQLNDILPNNPERSTALRKLLEAKDCAVRSVLFKLDLSEVE